MGENGLIMPPPLPPTSERLERHGLFLIEDGQTMFLWVGRDAVPQLIIDVFNLPSYDQLRGGKVRRISPFLLRTHTRTTCLGASFTGALHPSSHTRIS